MLIISLLIKLDSRGPVFFISKRIGQNNQKFEMIKFRTMHINTELIESAKLKNPNSKVTRLGKIMRKSSIDEIPQLFCVIKGQMAIVGPRPALPTQLDLINNRKKHGIDKIMPGITGYAQINGRDLISDKEKLNLEIEYMKKKNFLLDLKIIFKTIKVVFNRIGISH
jgi:O-antigen biosynthesis protein WbqP